MSNPKHFHLILDALAVGIEDADHRGDTYGVADRVTLDRPPMIGDLLPNTVRAIVEIDGSRYSVTIETVDG